MSNSTSPSLGEALIAQGLISAKQLDDALSAQKGSGLRLGQVLIERSIVSEEQIARILAAQQNLPFIDLRQFPIDTATALKLKEMHARKHRAIVLETRPHTYLVGITDPFNHSAQSALAALLQRPIEYAVVTSEQLGTVMDRVYLQGSTLTEYAREFASDIQQEQDVVNLSQMVSSGSDADVPVVRLLQTVFRLAAQKNASDIHIEAQEKQLVVRFRIDGALHTEVEADPRIASPLAVKLKLMAGLNIAEKRLPQDGRITVKIDESRVLDLRMSTMPTQYGESLVLRILMQSQGIKSLESLGMPTAMYQRFVKAISIPNGIVLSTGPTGSGKTTTLYGALAKLNSDEVKILTCEDPIEYRIAGINQVQINDKIGLSFPIVLRSFLRQDPDIILVGEIRDNETAEIATRAAMTGHLVLSTLHTNDAISTPSRLLDMGIPGFLIATTLRAVLSQRLLRTVCEACAEAQPLDANELDWVQHHHGHYNPQGLWRRGRGCVQCNGTGYRGRVGVFELLEMNAQLGAALHRNDAVTFEAEARQAIGNFTLAHQGVALAEQGRTTIAEVMRNLLATD